MSATTCGVSVTEILVAIGDSYWRCVACQLHFSKLTSIDEHIRQSHENTNNDAGSASENFTPLAQNSKLDATFGPSSFEQRIANNVSSVPSIFKVNLDNPNLREQNKLPHQNSSYHYQADQDPNNSSTELDSSKSHAVNQLPKSGNMGHLNCSSTDYVQPHDVRESLVISGELNDSINKISFTHKQSQLEQHNVNENVDDLEGDGNVSKAMLASMLSLLERGLEMDDISSVFQNLDSVSPEYFEQQLLNHSDLGDYPADSIDTNLENLPNVGRGNSKNVPAQSQTCRDKSDKVECSNGFKENGIQKEGTIYKDSPPVSEQLSQGGESTNENVNAEGETSSNIIHVTSCSDNSLLCGTKLKNQSTQLQGENINKNYEENQAESIDPGPLQAAKITEFRSKHTKVVNLMSSQIMKTESKSLEEISCRNISRNDRYFESTETLQEPISTNKDEYSKIISAFCVLPLSSGDSNNKTSETLHAIHRSSRKETLPTSTNKLFSGHFKKRVKLKQPANFSSSNLSNCTREAKGGKYVLAHMKQLSTYEETATPTSSNWLIDSQFEKENKDAMNHGNSKNTENGVISTSLMKKDKRSNLVPTADQGQLDIRKDHIEQSKRSTLVPNFKYDKSKKIKLDRKYEIGPPSTLMKYSAPEMINATNVVESEETSKSRYICTICDANFSSSGALQRHMKVNFALTKPCECKVCHKKFHCLSVLSIHIYKCHEGLGSPMCLVCYVKCSSTRYLVQHVRIHQKMEAKRLRRLQQIMHPSAKERIKSKYWGCGKCNAIILNEKKIIKNHVCTVSKICKQCNMEFPTLSTFKLHMASHQGRMFECNVCGEFFKNKATRDCHKLTHKKNFLCQICGKQFASQNMLSKHAKIHTEVRKANPDFTCAECNKVYKSKRSIQQHIKIVHLGMGYQFHCTHCPHKFLSSNQLREHVAWHHFGEKSYLCRYCEKTFVCRPTLIRHERNEHTGVKPYKCRFCPEAFVEKKFLDNHEVKKHTLVFPYKCEVCSKGFVQASYLRSHLLTHKKHKPHQCDVCGSCYTKASHLKRHKINCLNSLKKRSEVH